MSRSRKWFLAGSALLMLLSGAALVVSLVAFRHYRIPTEAMSPTIRPGQWVWSRPTGGGGIHRGEIVLLVRPGPASASARKLKVIARAVAVGGDTVEAAGGRLLINGSVDAERYLAPGMTTWDIAPIRVPEGTVYVLGDNRTNSQGSRVYGPVPLGNISERVSWVGAPATIVVVLLGAALCVPFLLALATTQGRRPLVTSPIG